MPCEQSPHSAAAEVKHKSARHDIRGCLNAVILSVSVLRTCRDQEDVDCYLGHIEAQVRKAERLLNEAA